MRIAMLPSSCLPDSIGGTEVYVDRIATELCRRGHDVAIVVHEGSASDGARDAEAWSRIGREVPEYVVVRLPGLEPADRDALYRSESSAAGFAEWCRKWKPDLLHFHAWTRGAGPAHVRDAPGIPYIITYHTPGMSCPRGTLLRSGTTPCDGELRPGRCARCVMQWRGWSRPARVLASLSPLPSKWVPERSWKTAACLPSLLRGMKDSWGRHFRGACRIIICSEWSADVLAANGAERSRMVLLRQPLPGVSRRRTLRMPSAPTTDAPLRLGFLGRMASMKGFDFVPAVVSRLNSMDVPTVAELVGPGDGSVDVRGALMRTAGPRPPARASVEWLGSRTGEELSSWTATRDVMIVPSRCLETGPMTVPEAWDAGVPVIASDLGGAGEQLRAAGMQDWLFRPDDAGSAADAMMRLLSWKGPAPEVSILGADRVADEHERIYAEVLSMNGPGGRR